MKFRPVTKKYSFDGQALIKTYPNYLKVPVAQWIEEVLHASQIWDYRTGIYGGTEMDEAFLNNLNVNFREHFPRELNELIPFILDDADRTSNFLALCLQNYATRLHVSKLDRILATGGSGYSVMLTVDRPDNYEKGVGDLVERVPEVVRVAAEEIMKMEDLVSIAWFSCYSQNPDYAKTVGKCVDALEGLFKEKYFPRDSKPSLGKFIKQFQDNYDVLAFKGDNLLYEKNS